MKFQTEKNNKTKINEKDNWLSKNINEPKKSPARQHKNISIINERKHIFIDPHQTSKRIRRRRQANCEFKMILRYLERLFQKQQQTRKDKGIL